ncbi:MAG: sterol desaturase family protein [Pseudomonadota bacterium]
MYIIFVALGVAVAMFLVELICPARQWKIVRHWWLRAIIFNSIQIAIVYLATLTWDLWFSGNHVWESKKYLGDGASIFVGYILITFIYYWWHRMRHDVYFLWRWCHQLHHSPQRIEILTAFYKHPIELIVNGFLSSLILYVFLGLEPSAVSQVILITGIAELFYHWNIKTPYWLGFIFQRPESHCIHHQYQHHKNNYSDLPLWDILFGTFQNPRESEFMCGFDDSKEQAVIPMLKGKDLYKRKQRK